MTKAGREEDERRAATLLALLGVAADLNGGGDEPDLAQARLFVEDLTVASGDPTALQAADLAKWVSQGLPVGVSAAKLVCCCPSRARFAHSNRPESEFTCCQPSRGSPLCRAVAVLP